MIIDVRTAVIILILGELFSGLIGFGYQIQNRFEPFVKYFLAARILNVIGWLFVALRETIGMPISVIVGNELIYLGSAFQAAVMLLLNNRLTSTIKLSYVVGGLVMLVSQIVFTTVIPSYPYRMGFFVGSFIFTWIMPIHYLIHSRPKTALRQILGYLYLVFLIAQVAQFMNGIGNGKEMLYPYLGGETNGAYIVGSFASILVYLAMQGGSIGTILMSKEMAYSTVLNQATYDDLTGAYSRRAFINRFEEAMVYHVQHQIPFAVLLLDIDNFKKINDSYSHLMGDQILVEFVKSIENVLMHRDVLGRIGGEEFMIVLHDCDQDQGEKTANAIRKVLGEQQFGLEAPVTVSIGMMALIPDEQTSFSQIYECTDNAMYDAKINGKDQTVVVEMQEAF